MIAHWVPASLSQPVEIYLQRWQKHGHGAAVQRSFLTLPLRIAKFSLSTISGDIRSSSFAHTDAEHATVTTPARSETGAASRAIASPTVAGQISCTSASIVSGSHASRSEPNARLI
jgi:hypothetical protein